MSENTRAIEILSRRALRVWMTALFVFVFLGSFGPAIAQTQLSTSPDEKTLTVEEAPDMEVYALGKSVIIKGTAKGVLAFGGDVIVEGRIEGDAAAIGGSIIQKKDAFIGGDVIVFGGTYKPEAEIPLRNEGKETVMFGVFEDELRDLAQNPSQILSPSLSWAFFAQRVLSILFWFIVSLAIATIAPGAVSRAVARIQLSALKVTGIGFAAFILTTIAVIGSFSVLPDYLSALIGLMSFFLLMLAYVFGRVALHVSFGKLFQKHVLASNPGSGTLSILIGVVIWTILLSIPYIWTFAVLALFSAGIGLAITQQTTASWQRR